MKQQALDYSSKSVTVGNLKVLGGLSGQAVTALAQSIKTAQSKAQSVAADLSGAIKAFADDGILTPVEKKSVKQELDAIAAEYPVIVEAAQDAGLTAAEIAAYTASYDALAAYIQGTKILDDMSANTSIDRDAFTSAFTDYYNDRLTFQSLIFIAQSKTIAREATVKLDVSVSSISRNRAGVLTPGSITVSARHDDAIPFAGIFFISLSADGDDWQAAYVSSSLESSHEFTVPATFTIESTPFYVAYVRVRLYADAEYSIRKGETILSVVADVSTVPYYFGAREAAPTTGYVVNDFYFDNRTVEGSGKLLYWTGSAWAQIGAEHPYYSSAVKVALSDMVAWCTANSGTIGEVTAFVTAIINNLIAKTAIIDSLATSTQVSTALCSDGTTRRAEINWDTAIQKFRSIDQDKVMTLTDGFIEFLAEKLEARRSLEIGGDSLRWFNKPEGGTKAEIASMARVSSSFNGILLSGEMYTEEKNAEWHDALIDTLMCETPTRLVMSNGEEHLLYVRHSDGVVLERIKQNGAWSSATTYISEIVYYIDSIVLQNGIRLIVYQKRSDSMLYSRLQSTDGTFQDELVIENTERTFRPTVIQTKDGCIRVAYQTEVTPVTYERIIVNGIWGNRSTIHNYSAPDIKYCEMQDGELHLVYNRSGYGVVEKVLRPEGWGDEVVLYSLYGMLPTLVQLISGEKRLFYKYIDNGSYKYFYRTITGTMLGDAVVVIDGNVNYPNIKLLPTGSVAIFYEGYDPYTLRETIQEQYALIGGSVLTSDQLAALAGNYGTPSATNKYVTMYDPLLVTNAGTSTIYSNSGDVQTTSTSPIKAKSKVTQRYGIIRVAFGIRTNVDSTNPIYGRVYINGNPVGPVYSTTSKTTVLYEGDFTIKRGDDIQVYIWCSYSNTPCICSYMTFKKDNTAVV